MRTPSNLIILLLFVTFLASCSSVSNVEKLTIVPILEKNITTWNLDECNTIIEHYSSTNKIPEIFKTLRTNDVAIKVLSLNKNVITAIVRKEIIEKRFDNNVFKYNLKEYLEEYSSYTLDTNIMKIEIADSNYSSGISFKLFLENVTDPFEPIFLEDGYSYFFLENQNGKFSRVNEVTGLYVEDYIQLDGYLNVVVTFSPFASDGSRLFSSNDLDENYKLIFNGLQKEPIVIEWKTK